jgi:predicted anti-sigma-YlaC factor YlaD
MTRPGWPQGRRAVVGCDEVQEAISARLDGERPPHAQAAVDGHLAGCGACRDFQTEVVALGRLAHLRTPRPVPADLLATLAPLVEPARPGLRGSARYLGPGERSGPGWTRTARWAGAMVPAALAVVAIIAGVGSPPRLVPTRPPSPCTIGLVAHHQRGG